MLTIINCFKFNIRVYIIFLGIPGLIIAFGIIAGSLFWGLYLLIGIREKLSSVSRHLNISDEEVVQLSNDEIETELEEGFKK